MEARICYHVEDQEEPCVTWAAVEGTGMSWARWIRVIDVEVAHKTESEGNSKMSVIYLKRYEGAPTI